MKKQKSSPLKPYRQGKSPLKENSPLKKMGTLRKQSQLAALENVESPLKAFRQGPSPQKRVPGKLLQKSISCDVNDQVNSRSPLKASPLKKQMRMF